MSKQAVDTIIKPKILIIGVHSPHNTTQDIGAYFQEFINLVTSNGIVHDHELYIKLRTIDTGTFFTKGKLEDLIRFCGENEIEEVIISDRLSPQQENSLNKLLDCRVFDRTQLILEIFEKGAISRESKIQIAIAFLKHKKSRLAGRGINMSQQSGRIGARGPGETKKESDIQHIEHLTLKLKRDLTQLEVVRSTQRKSRLLHNVPLFCLIGYTNAGKSSILNALTKSAVLAEDKLFATLDTTTRELYLNGKKKGLLSDTVGFIQQLPHQLIEAFKSTLSELQHAHLLVHVIDVSDINWQAHIIVVNNVLKELELDKPILHVFNKSDLVAADDLRLAATLEQYQPYVLCSTLTKAGLSELVAHLDAWQFPVDEEDEQV